MGLGNTLAHIYLNHWAEGIERNDINTQYLDQANIQTTQKAMLDEPEIDASFQQSALDLTRNLLT